MTPWTVAFQDPLSMGFPKQESWSVLLFPSPWDLSDPEIETTSLALQMDFFFFFFNHRATWAGLLLIYLNTKIKAIHGIQI